MNRSGAELVRSGLDRVRRLAGAIRRRGTPVRLVAALLAVALPVAGMVAATGSGTVPVPRGAWWSGAQPLATPEPEVAPERPRDPPRALGNRPTTRPLPVESVDPAGDFVGWAVLDLATGTVTGSDNLAEVSTTASMIKPWIVADYLRQAAKTGSPPGPARLVELTEIIRDSHNAYTHALFRELGSHASIERMIDICGLTDSSAVPSLWSNTRMSPGDTARMAACLADGRAAGPDWTGWLLDEMRAVRGLGDFGIRHAFPAGQRATIAIKNGWVVRDDQRAWHVNCLAVGDGWTMGVMTRYPERLGYRHGAELCRSLAATHLLP